MPKSVEIFFCYAREDEVLRQGLEKQLRALKRQGVVDVWHDRMIEAGTEWERSIDQHLNTAQVILLLVSPDFMDSDYCYGIEMKRAMERHERGEARVIPIILRHVYWQKAPFGKLQALPTDGEPVVSRKWFNQDEAFFSVAEGVRLAVESIEKKEQEWVQSLVKEGITLYEKGRYADSLPIFDQALLFDGNNANALRYRGNVYRLLSRYNEALADLNRSLTLEPNSAFALRGRGATYRTLKQYNEALADLNRSLELEPDNAVTLGRRGETYRILKQYDKALNDLNRSLDLQPNDLFFQESRAKALQGNSNPIYLKRLHKAT